MMKLLVVLVALVCAASASSLRGKKRGEEAPAPADPEEKGGPLEGEGLEFPNDNQLRGLIGLLRQELARAQAREREAGGAPAPSKRGFARMLRELLAKRDDSQVGAARREEPLSAEDIRELIEVFQAFLEEGEENGDDSAEPEGGEEPVDPASPAGPANPANPAEPGEPGQAAEPADPAEPSPGAAKRDEVGDVVEEEEEEEEEEEVEEEAEAASQGGANGAAGKANAISKSGNNAQGLLKDLRELERALRHMN